MIESLNVRNFRCFSDIELKSIRPITIISGKNNIGKSSLLEAIFFMYDHANGTPFLKMNRNRGEALNRSVHNTWESFFYMMNSDNSIRIDMEIDGLESTLSFTKEEASLLDLSKELANSPQAFTFLNNMYSYALKMEYTRGQYKEEADYVFVAGVEHTQMVKDIVCKRNGELSSRELMGNLTYLANKDNRDDSILVDLLSKLEMTNRKQDLIEIINKIDEDVTDVMVLSTDGIAQLYVRKNNLTIPLRYSGDGMLKIIGMILRILADPGCILLIDEIENGLHYSQYEYLWKIIAEAAQTNGCQIIATTHSYDCIRAAAQGIGDAMRKDEFCYVRLEKIDKQITSQVYDYDMLTDSLSIEAEIR